MIKSTIFLSASLAFCLVLPACSSDQPQQTATTQPNSPQVTNIAPEEWDYWAKDNLDLQRVGPLLEKSRSAPEFESYLNRRDGINNLDLNGDGYVDYLSVDEYSDCNEYECGMSIYDRFGPDQIQELATVVFYRDEPRYRGSRILITGNDQIYGDNFYYETNWLDRTLNLVSYLFTDHDRYRSPYYYDYYPNDYVVYEVVETPVYRTRIEQLYPQPVFVYTTAPTFIEKIKIKSPNYGRSMEKVYAKLAKPTKEQAEFKKNNPGKPKFEKPEKADKGSKDKGFERSDERGGGADKDRGPGKQKQADQGKPDKPDDKGQKPDRGQGADKGLKQDKGQSPDKGQKPDKGGNGKGKKKGG